MVLDPKHTENNEQSDFGTQLGRIILSLYDLMPDLAGSGTERERESVIRKTEKESGCGKQGPENNVFVRLMCRFRFYSPNNACTEGF